jgi:putative transposase
MYISGIVRNKGQKLLTIYCMPDHTHLLIGMKPEIRVSDLVRDIKSNSSKFINEERLMPGMFHWQEGFGAFSCSLREIPVIGKYIDNQPDHHSAKTFREEYIGLLEESGIDYDERYIFQ